MELAQLFQLLAPIPGIGIAIFVYYIMRSMNKEYYFMQKKSNDIIKEITNVLTLINDRLKRLEDILDRRL